MAARTPNVLNAGIEIGFVLAAGLFGFLRAPLWTAPALAAAMMVYWAFNRRAGLTQARQVGLGRLAGLVLVSLALMSAVLGGAYWLGGLAAGRTT